MKRLKKQCSIEEINHELEDKLSQINSNISLQHLNVTTSYVKLENPTNPTNSENEWWAKVKYSLHAEWQQFEHDGYTILSSGRYSSVFKSKCSYEIDAVFHAPSKRGKTSVLFPKYISRLTLLSDSLSLQSDRDNFTKLRDQGTILNENGWKTKLTPKEFSEQEKERATIRKRLSYFATEREKVRMVHQVLAPKIKPFQQVEKEWRQCKVKSKSTFPNSMTFVQNPAYQAVHSGFKKLKERIGLADEDILLSLEKIEAIGLLNMPLLYERWCLLQIIKVLTQALRYQPEENWKRKLIANIQGNEEQISIHFFNPSVSRTITLQYEPYLANGKRPDFVLDVEATTKSGNQISKRLVVDAKYYSAAYLKQRGGIGGVIHELYCGKDYSEGQANSVFVLHPVLEAVENVVSPQEWAKDSYLGELSMFDWEPAYHERQATNYGAVCAYSGRS